LPRCPVAGAGACASGEWGWRDGLVPRCPVAGAGACARRVRAGPVTASVGQGVGCPMAAPVPRRRRRRSACRSLERRALRSCGAAVRRAGGGGGAAELNEAAGSGVWVSRQDSLPEGVRAKVDVLGRWMSASWTISFLWAVDKKNISPKSRVVLKREEYTNNRGWVRDLD
jgi:hypothetical protein